MRPALVVGATGLVGGALAEALGPGRCAAASVRDPGEFPGLVDRTDPWAVVLAGGISSAEACEADEAAARACHAEAASAAAAACAALDVPLVYVSCDAVFDGAAGPYAEDAEPLPVSVLGRAKAAGEAAVLRASKRNLVIRTSWVFGPEAAGAGIAYRIGSALAAGRAVPVAADQYSTPTYARDLARAAVALLEKGHAGIVHVAGPEVLNAADFALLVAARSRAPLRLVKPVASATLGMAALRPPFGGLLCGRLKTFLPGFSMRAPGAAMDHWMKNQRGALWPF